MRILPKNSTTSTFLQLISRTVWRIKLNVKPKYLKSRQFFFLIALGGQYHSLRSEMFFVVVCRFNLGDQKLSICNSFPTIVGLLLEPNEVVLLNVRITIQEYSRQINTSKCQ